MHRCINAAGKQLISTICATITLSFLSLQPISAQDADAQPQASDKAAVFKELRPDGRNRVAATILIHARPETVWETVHAERQKDPDLAYAKVLKTDNNEITIEEKFVLIPVIGSAVCIMKDKEITRERIDYQMVKSDRFKAMEGSWVLRPTDDGKSTILTLSSYLDLGMPVPRFMLDMITTQKLEKRITNVKIMSEKVETKTASQAPAPPA